MLNLKTKFSIKQLGTFYPTHYREVCKKKRNTVSCWLINNTWNFLNTHKRLFNWSVHRFYGASNSRAPVYIQVPADEQSQKAGLLGGMLLGHFPGNLVVFTAVLLVDHGNVRHQRVFWVGLRQQGQNRQQHWNTHHIVGMGKSLTRTLKHRMILVWIYYEGKAYTGKLSQCIWLKNNFTNKIKETLCFYSQFCLNHYLSTQTFCLQPACILH